MKIIFISLLAAFLAVTASAQETVEVERSEIAVGELNVDLSFTCPVAGLPTVTLYYIRGDTNQRSLHFWQNREPKVTFVLHDAVTTVTKEVEAAETRWLIAGSGKATEAEGMASGEAVSARLLIRQPADNSGLTLDFEIEAGEFVKAENDCPRGPAIDRSSEAQ